MKILITVTLLITLACIIELMYGIHDTGATIAFVLLCWCSLSIPVGLVVGTVIGEVSEGLEGGSHEL